MTETYYDLGTLDVVRDVSCLVEAGWSFRSREEMEGT
jgi:hypothetical protein